MAAPHVTGLVALMAQRQPSLTAAQAEAVLTGTAIPIPGVPASDQGSGLATADAALAGLSSTATTTTKRR
jgi:serine protease